MKGEEVRIMAKRIAEEAHALATPIDFRRLVDDGVLKRHGKSYYTDDLRNLPEHVAKKIKSIAQTKRGIRLSFYKETKSVKKLAEKTKNWRD